MKSLHDSVRSECIDDIKTALLSGANIDEADSHSRTPLHLAAWKNNIDILNLLISFKVNVNATAMDNFTAVHFAAQNANGSEFIRILIKKDKRLLDQRIKKDNKTALHLAVAKGNKDVVRCLIDLGSDILAKTNSGRTPYDFIKNDDNEMKEILQSALNKRSTKKNELPKMNEVDGNKMTDNNNNSNNNNSNNNSSNNNGNITISDNTIKLTVPIAQPMSNKIRIILDSDDDDDNNKNPSKRLRDAEEDEEIGTTADINDSGIEEEKIVVKNIIKKNNKRKIILTHLENDDDDN
jgi:hypothetical protein